ncbi:MAG: HAD family phosphatase [Rhodoblastus sp.]|nr:HAD family phosphatase [Rhodoblastus sp.]
MSARTINAGFLVARKDVVFDLGNVLLRWDPRHLYRKVFADAVRMEEFLAGACSLAWIHSIDGVQDFAEPIAARAKEFPEFAAELALFDTRWLETLDGAIEDNLAIMRDLKAQGRPVYGLTNYPAQKFELSRAIHPFLDDFDTIVVSGREGVTKPDPRIYETLFARARRAPEELVFVDDVARNIAAAEKLGMAGVLYTPGMDLAAALRNLGAL